MIAVALFIPSMSRADSRTPSTGDGLYQRFSGDLALDVSAGARVPLVHEPRVGAMGRVGALYLASVGAFVAVDHGLRSPDQLGTSLGVELRPLFVPRFSTASEFGNATTDLLIDSLSFSIAARWVGEHRVALDLGTGFEVPLGASYAGPLLALRFSHVMGQGALRGDERERGVDGNFVTITLGWRGLITSHLVDANDINAR
jgi:hypothetical protein